MKIIKILSMTKMDRRALLVVIGYIGGVLFGFLATWLSHLHVTAHPQQISASEIILHNIGVVGIMFLGILTFGFITLGVLFINGTMLGAAMGIYAVQGKLGALLLSLAPHGILEIGAYLLASYGCLSIVSYLWHMVRTGHWNYSKQQHVLLRNSIIYAIVAIAMLIIAGYIESAVFITV